MGGDGESFRNQDPPWWDHDSMEDFWEALQFKKKWLMMILLSQSMSLQIHFRYWTWRNNSLFYEGHDFGQYFFIPRSYYMHKNDYNRDYRAQTRTNRSERYDSFDKESGWRTHPDKETVFNCRLYAVAFLIWRRFIKIKVNVQKWHTSPDYVNRTFSKIIWLSSMEFLLYVLIEFSTIIFIIWVIAQCNIEWKYIFRT